MSDLFSVRRALLRSGSALSSASLFLALSLSAVHAADDTTPAASETKPAPDATLPELAVDTTLDADTPSTTVLTPAQTGTMRPSADLGALLSDLQGISSGKMGQHASDIMIRGQSQDRLAVINDGAYAFGGCPNRMDPPTALISEASIDTVTIQRGYQTVTNGAPAPGGSVIVDRQRPTFDTLGATGSIDAGIETNGNLRKGSINASAGIKEGYLRGFADSGRADSYKDGKGTLVRSGFKSESGGLETGWNISDDTHLSVGAERMESTDVLFAGAGMDGVFDGNTTYRIKGDHQFQDAGPLHSLSFSAYQSQVDHIMDNYSLRAATGMKMVTNSTSNTYGGTASVDWQFSGITLTTGMDHRTNTRDAQSRTGMAAGLDPTTISGYTWPDMQISDTGLFAEAKAPVGSATVLTAGARLDRVEADARNADATPQNGTSSARVLYRQYYGSDDVTQEEYNLSGLLRLEHDFGPLSGWASASRAVRTADATERGIARSSGAASWVGNPTLKPEKHYQVETGLSAKRSDWGVTGGVWYDQVEDFITRDTARGQSGVLMSNGASIFRNVDARLAGVDLAGSWQATSALKLNATITYTYGDNTSDDRPLYQIPPLQGTIEAAYTMGDVTFGPRLRWATTQTRVDTSSANGSGLDVQKTSGYGMIDLFATWSPTDAVELRAGVSNLFDHTYASHLNRSNGVDPTMVQVNEAGQSFSVGGKIRF
ncbi:TonB-dependent receptor domain-containing protein [Insolitispirillum peregrinum]|uniref:TonB-dependent receptor domain-containing protein n=1 Tax=Insolitispirillum peregrinum TaxID=80876 RepID=UPI0036232B30